MEATEVVALPAAALAPRPVVATMGGPAATEAGRVVADLPSTQGLTLAVAGRVPILPTCRELPSTTLPFLARQVALLVGLVGREVVTTAMAGVRRPILGLGAFQVTRLATRPTGVVLGTGVPRRPTSGRRETGLLPGLPATKVGIGATDATSVLP